MRVGLSGSSRSSLTLPLLCVHLLSGCALTASYNVDVDSRIAVRGPARSWFGYSVLLHTFEGRCWYVSRLASVRWDFGSSLQSVNDAGCGRTCAAEYDSQWLGVSLSGDRRDGRVLTCGHRWKNVFYSKREKLHKLPHGICYQLEPDLIQSRRFIPCYRDHHRKFGEDYGSCQAGISSFLTQDLVVMGAPGTSYWTGSVLVYNMSSHQPSAYLDNDNIVLHGSYLGYSVAAGHFRHPNTTEVVGGAPQHGQMGKAYIFKVEPPNLEIIFETASCRQLGSYFGSNVCAVDLNSDGLSDLLVGAPMYSSVREEGRVYVYMNLGAADMSEQEFTLEGSNSYAARFGETIANLGDIDDDGFPDVAVGAPQEEEQQGALYIYNGRRTGISRTFSQRIAGKALGLKMFGQAVSGGIDVDGNGYPDVAVGAFLSDSAVVLRTRAVVQVQASVLLPLSVNLSHPQCTEGGRLAACVNAAVCFRIQGKSIDGLIEILYNLTADVKRKDGLSSRFYFPGNGNLGVAVGRVGFHRGKHTCMHFLFSMQTDTRDIFTPVHFELRYAPGVHTPLHGGPTKLPLLAPLLQQSGWQSNTVGNKTEFARHCLFSNCSPNLQVVAHLVLPHTHANLSYLALGSGKNILLNVVLANAGDEAFLPKLHLRFPSNIYFVKVQVAENVRVNCEAAEEERVIVGLDCNVENLYIQSLAKINVSFLLDVNLSSNAGDHIIVINATCENFENEEFLHDNSASLKLPLRYGVDLNVQGSVSPSSFVFGDQETVDCSMLRFNYTFQIQNVGPSRAPDTRVDIDVPKTLAPYPHRLLSIIRAEVRTRLSSSNGHCYPTYSPNITTADCTKRKMYCMRRDPLCWYIVCELVDLHIGEQATITIEAELNPAVLDISPVRLLQLPFTTPINMSLPLASQVVLEAYYSQRLWEEVALFIITVSLGLGLLILSAIIFCLWKVGFVTLDNISDCVLTGCLPFLTTSSMKFQVPCNWSVKQTDSSSRSLAGGLLQEEV
uniref:Integrin alpha 4 n=1 Tax=Scleropages formosus TaxID=113540 RepID=A0A8C9RLF5_SCLFO